MQKKNLISITIILFISCIATVMAVPHFIFNYQVPNDIDSLNLLDTRVNISYNISDDADTINASSVKLFFKLNTSTSDCSFFVNGTQSCGYLNPEITQTNESDKWEFLIPHEYIYSGSYNYDGIYMVNAVKSQYDLDSLFEYVKVEFLNVSNRKAHNFFFFNAYNQSAEADTLRLYFCNSSYTTGSPASSENCINFYNQESSEPFNATPNNSRYHRAPLTINTTTGTISGLYVTNTSYLLFRGRGGNDAWWLDYIPNVSRIDAIQNSAFNGNSWDNFSGTIDVHLHQFESSDKVWYYACANNTLDEQNCSSVSQDLVGFGNLAPNAPNVYNPNNSYYSNLIIINYSGSESPNGYAINFYNLTLVNFTDDYVATITANNSANLSYIWNSSSVDDGSYNLHVTACDVNWQCATGESDDFTIDNTVPSNIALNYPNNSIIISTSSTTLNWTVSDNLGTNFTCNLTINGAVNATVNTLNETMANYTFQNLAEASYSWNVTCKDNAGNVNTSELRSFTVDFPDDTEDSGDSGTSSPGGGATPASRELGCVQEWNCSEWSECINGTMARICIDNEGCNNLTGKPDESKSCGIASEEAEEKAVEEIERELPIEPERSSLTTKALEKTKEIALSVWQGTKKTEAITKNSLLKANDFIKEKLANYNKSPYSTVINILLTVTLTFLLLRKYGVNIKKKVTKGCNSIYCKLKTKIKNLKKKSSK